MRVRTRGILVFLGDSVEPIHQGGELGNHVCIHTL